MGPVWWAWRLFLAWRRWGYVIVEDNGRTWLFNVRSEEAVEITHPNNGQRPLARNIDGSLTVGNFYEDLYRELACAKQRATVVSRLSAAVEASRLGERDERAAESGALSVAPRPRPLGPPPRPPLPPLPPPPAARAPTGAHRPPPCGSAVKRGEVPQ